MRNVVVLLVALAAFGAGYYAGSAAPRERARGDRERAARGGEEAGRVPLTWEAPGPDGVPAAPVAADAPAPAALRPDTAVRWFVEPADFVLWYRVHEKAYDLPPADDALLESFGHDVIVALRRIPRPELLRTLLAHYRRYQPLRDGSNDEMVRGLRILLDDLHGELAYSDYLLLATGDSLGGDWVEAGEIVLRPRGPDPRPGADPYARSDLWASAREHFRAWYRAYRYDLGLPERDAEALDDFCRDVIYPLGRVPKPALLRALFDVYAPYRAAGPRDVTREEWEALARRLFEEFERVLPPLDYERMRRSDRWEVDCRELGILPG